MSEILAEPDHIKQIYHMAMAGVPIEYDGLQGDRLAARAVSDLLAQEDPEADEYTDAYCGVLRDRFYDHRGDPWRIINGLFAARFAYTHERPGSLDRLQEDYAHYVGNDHFENMFRPDVLAQFTDIQESERIIPARALGSILCARELETANCVSAPNELEDAIIHGVASMQDALIRDPQTFTEPVVDATLQIITELRGSEMGAWAEDSLGRLMVQLAYSWRNLDGSAKVAALSMLGLLRGVVPEDRGLCKEARKAVMSVRRPWDPDSLGVDDQTYSHLVQGIRPLDFGRTISSSWNIYTGLEAEASRLSGITSLR